MKNTSILIVAYVMVLLTFSCSQEPPPPFTGEIVDDILKKFDLLPQITETAVIDFTKQDSAKHLVSGWYKNAEEFTWGKGPTSVFAFEAFHTKNKKTLEITCAPLYTSELQSQEIALSLNENLIGNLKLDHGMHTYRLDMPASKLRTGRNLVQMEYTYTLDLPNSELPRLAAMFEKITIKGSPEVPQDHFKFKEDGSLVQFASSLFSYSHPYPEPRKIVLDYKIRGNVSAVVVINMSGSPGIEHSLPSKKTHMEFDIPATTPLPLRLDFVVNGKGRSGYVEWKNLSICRLPEGNKDLERVEPSTADQKNHLSKPETHPDIIFYIIDALRSDHLGCYGYTRDTTPNMDDFANSNTLYKQAYANASWTRPSGATILTGLLPKNHRTTIRDSKLPDELLTLPEVLQGLGYYTVAINTNGNVGEGYGFGKGFDEFIALPEDLERESVHQRSDVLNKKTFEFLERFLQVKPRKPLFLWIWSSDPHDPYTPHESVKQAFNIQNYRPLSKKYWFLNNLGKRIKATKFRWPSQSEIGYLMALYDQEILFNDRSFGNLIHKLKQTQIYEDAVIILTSDHGEEFFDHNWIGHGKTLFQEQIKIPLAIRAPQIQQGEVDTRVQHADIFPTLMDIIGAPLPYELDGMSILNMAALQDRPLFAEETVDGHDLRSILKGDYKLIHNLPTVGYLNVPWRDVYPYEFFNLRDDPTEHNNMADLTDTTFAYLIQKLTYEFSDFRKGLDIESEKATISPKMEEMLKALGYIK